MVCQPLKSDEKAALFEAGFHEIVDAYYGPSYSKMTKQLSELFYKCDNQYFYAYMRGNFLYNILMDLVGIRKIQTLCSGTFEEMFGLIYVEQEVAVKIDPNFKTTS